MLLKDKYKPTFLDLESLLRKEAGIKDVSIDTKYININSVRTLINKINQSNAL